jgi:L,D-transpeptidase catalytic domain
MRNKYRVLSVALLLSLSPVLQSGNGLMATPIKKIPAASTLSTKSLEFEAEVSNLYCEMDLEESGLHREVFEYAYIGYLRLLEQHKIMKSNIITICDFSQSSRNRRLYVVDLDTRKILVNTYVAHGRRSGGEYAQTFSNKWSSHKSSLGFYVTELTYTGKHGLALKIHGLEKGFNDKADRRNIVIHGSKYVGEKFIQSNKFNGRSFGCPAIPNEDVKEVIEDMKGGSCFFIYHPTKKYLTGSKILNG